MAKTSIRYTSYPRTEPPAAFVASIVEAFRSAEAQIGSEGLVKGLTSDAVLKVLHPQLRGSRISDREGKLKTRRSIGLCSSVRTACLNCAIRSMLIARPGSMA
jgi:hypothetical protein